MRTLRNTPHKSVPGLVLLALLLVSLTTTLVPPARVAAAPLIQQLVCSEEDLAFAWPFEDFVFGVYGQHTTISYGMKSWDLFGSGGTHPPVLSPINGEVTANHTDAKGNTVLKIENNCRYVLLLHGNWEVQIGAQIQIGNVVGTQDNNGQSWGANGQPCNGVEGCAEHVHLDVYDKVKGDWVDPKTDELNVQPTKMNEPLLEKLSYVVPDSPTEVSESVQTGRGNLSHWLYANWMWFVLGFALIFVITGTQFGLSLRTTFAIVGIGLLSYAWWIPSTSTWLASPIDGSTPINTHYGDVRLDPQGTTATTWQVVAGTPIRAIAPGIVVNTPDPLEGYFGYQQIWVDIGNGLYIQYAMPASSSAKVFPGIKVKVGQEIGVTAAGEFRLGVSSKNPDEFVSVDDRTYGWMDPEQYLGKSTLSGGRQNEAVFMILGFALFIIALFWPGNEKKSRDDFPFPWNQSMARYQNIKLILGLCLVAIGIMLGGPWFLWIGANPTALSLVYFIGRLSYRKSPQWEVSTKSYLMSILSMIFETTLVVGLFVAAVANPNIVFVRRAIALELPTITTPRLPQWDVPQMVSNSNVAVPDDGDLIPSVSPDNLGDTHAVKPFSFTYWNGGNYRVDIPQEVWDAAMTADIKHGCDGRLIIAIAWTESPNFTNYTTENSAGAMGTWQFLQGTFNHYYPDAATRPSRTDVYASADAACRKAIAQGLPQTDGNRALYIDRFAHHPLSESVWNMHDGQAGTAYDLWQELKKRSTSSTTQPPSTVATLSDWTLLTQATGTDVYQSGSNFLAIADLSKGAQVVLTGGNQCTSIDDHWQELGVNGVFVSNATYYESSCETTFPFIKNGVEVSNGVKTSQYPGARYLTISGSQAAILTYNDWVNGTRAPYMTAGLSPSAESARNAYTLIGVSANGQMVMILQVTSSTPQQGVTMLEALGIPDSNIILLDGGGSTQGIYATGYTRNTGRLIPQGIGIISP